MDMDSSSSALKSAEDPNYPPRKQCGDEEKGVMKVVDVEEGGGGTAPCTPDCSSSALDSRGLLPGGKVQQQHQASTAPSFCPFISFTAFLVLLAGALTLSAVVGFYLSRRLGIGLVAVMTNAFIMAYCAWRYRRSVLLSQAVATFLEALCIMAPMVVLENAWWYSVVVALRLPRRHTSDCGPCILSAFFDSYLTAGLFEELVKYLSLLPLVRAAHVMHPAALVAYGAWAGSAFEVVESLLFYDFKDGLIAAIFRSITPLHAVTGMIIGATLAMHRFSPRRSFLGRRERWYKTLAMPVLLHGTYDFLDFLLPGQIAAPIMEFVLLLTGFIYLRLLVNRLLLHSREIDVRGHLVLVQATRLAAATTEEEDEEEAGGDKDDEDDNGRRVPTLRRLACLLVMAAVATHLSYLAISPLVPPHYNVHTWADWLRAFTTT